MDDTNNTDDADETKQHIYTRNKDGLEIEVRDPIQDIMNDDELDEANKRFESLL